MAVARLKLANPQPLVTLEHHPYQIAFMDARRIRVCQNGHQWRFAYDGRVRDHNCPRCGAGSIRGYRYFLLRAGRRGGKTRIGALAAIEELSVPNTMGWATAPTYPMLGESVLDQFFKQIPQAWLDDPRTHWSESDLTLTLPNRSMCRFRSLEDPDRARGSGVHFWWIDEVNLLTEQHWQVGRPMLSDYKGIAILTSTPRGFDWVHDLFWERASQGRPGYWATHYATSANPGMPQEEIDEARESMTELMFRQEYMAEIVTFQGAIWGEILGPAIIDGTPDQLSFYLPEWPRVDPGRDNVTGIDPGTDHPFAGVQFVQTPRGLVAIGEYEQRNAVYKQHAEAILAMRRGLTNMRVGIDRSQAQAQIELAQYGLYTVPADNDVVAGVNRVAAWLLASKLKHMPSGLPRGLVLPRSLVPKLITSMQAYRWADSTLKDGSTKQRELVYKRKDDLCDAIRYGLMTFPSLPKADPDAAILKVRDLGGLPDHVRLDIERERRSQAQADAKHEQERVQDLAMSGVYDEIDSPDAGMGDFYQ